MSKLCISNILVLLLMMISCSTEKPKHLILGNWQALDSQKVVFAFDEDKILNTKIFGSNNHVYEARQNYYIVNERNVFFVHNSSNEDEKVTYNIKLINDNELVLDCEFKVWINGKARVDPPQLCLFKSFKRIN